MCSDPWHSSPAQPVQPVQPVQDTERAAFEKWWDTSQPDEDSIANFAWRGWQARAERAAERDDAETIKTALQRAAERLKRLSFEITGNDYALTEQSPEEVSASLQAYRENVLDDFLISSATEKRDKVDAALSCIREALLSGPQPIPAKSQCVGYEGGCDGDLVGFEHEPNCPAAQPIPEHAKLPIDRPCSACSDGDTEMKYHDHAPPFRVREFPKEDAP